MTSRSVGIISARWSAGHGSRDRLVRGGARRIVRAALQGGCCRALALARLLTVSEGACSRSGLNHRFPCDGALPPILAAGRKRQLAATSDGKLTQAASAMTGPWDQTEPGHSDFAKIYIMSILTTIAEPRKAATRPLFCQRQDFRWHV